MLCTCPAHAWSPEGTQHTLCFGRCHSGRAGDRIQTGCASEVQSAAKPCHCLRVYFCGPPMQCMQAGLSGRGEVHD